MWYLLGNGNLPAPVSPLTFVPVSIGLGPSYVIPGICYALLTLHKGSLSSSNLTLLDQNYPHHTVPA